MDGDPRPELFRLAVQRHTMRINLSVVEVIHFHVQSM